MAKHIRWYFNVTNWKPTKEEWLKLTSSVASEELERINKFWYQDSAKASIIGRALIRKFVSQVIGRPSSELGFFRNEHGRPEVCFDYRKKLNISWPKVFDFNVSHSGDFCVLAGLWSYEEQEEMTVGVDVTKIIAMRTKPELDRYLSLMSRREFTPDEWDTVANVNEDRQKCINFTRLWCLKESFIKSIGLGLSFKLSRISFKPEPDWRYCITPDKLMNRMLASTKVLLDGQLANDWIFLETALDNEHLVALGYNLKTCTTSYCDNQLLVKFKVDEKPFQELNISHLLDGLTLITDSKEENWNLFSAKPLRRS